MLECTALVLGQEHVVNARDGVQCRSCVRNRSTVNCSELVLIHIFSMLSRFSKTASPPAPLILELEIDDKRSFTSLEHFTGKLTIKTLAHTSFDKLEIKLTGISRTYGRRVVPQAPSARTVTTAHRFLELTQPDVLSHIPEDRLFEAGCTYEIPFEFAIPERMLPTTCRHVVASPRVHGLHTSMPPSFGDHELADAPDYAPRNASIKYRVVANVQKVWESGEWSEIAGASEPICFMPKDGAEEACGEAWEPARLTQSEISVSRLWAKPSGQLAVISTRSTPFVLNDLHKSVWRNQLSGSVEIDLIFYPAWDGANPPAQIDLGVLLRTTTISAVSPLTQLLSDDQWIGPQIDKHTAPSIILSPHVIENIEWSQGPHETTQLGENCPAYKALPTYATPQNLTSKLCYSTQIEATLNATSASLLVPTFHSCLIARSYDLDLRLSLPGSAIGLGPAMRISLPVQVMSEAAATRHDSVVPREELLRIELGCNPSCEDLGLTHPEGPPPIYQATSV